MAFFLKLAVFSVWVMIMAALIIGSIQGSKRIKRRRRQERVKPAGEKEIGRYFSCPLIYSGQGVCSLK